MSRKSQRSYLMPKKDSTILQSYLYKKEQVMRERAERLIRLTDLNLGMSREPSQKRIKQRLNGTQSDLRRRKLLIGSQTIANPTRSFKQSGMKRKASQINKTTM